MSVSLLIAAPLLALTVVVALGFAGCSFEHGVVPEEEEGLTFKARVPTALTVKAGVVFAWTRPTTVAETITVTAFTTDGADNVFEHRIPAPEAGSWLGRCEMTVEAENQAADGTSGDHVFMLDFSAMRQNVYLFLAQGSPLTGDFHVVTEGLKEA